MAQKKKPAKAVTKRVKVAKPVKVVPKRKNKPGAGRPTDYREEHNELAYKLCLLGAKDTEIADILGVSEQTLNAWKTAHPKFLESMRDGKEVADATIANSLYQRAKGYSHPDVHISNFQGAITETPLTKHYPPDTAAASLWLRNRQPQRWRDKIDHELAGKNGGPIEHKHDVTLSAEESYHQMLEG
jgi:hypothetical protein